MKKYLIFIPIIILGLVFLFNPFKDKSKDGEEMAPLEVPIGKAANENATDENASDEKSMPVSISNPASENCEEKGGSLEMVTNKDGSQFAMCNFEDYSCEEWVFFRGECTVEEDSEKIREALIAKNLNLSGMKVVIRHHLGKYIGGAVVPVSELAGGGYVFAAKDGANIKIVADGNGIITCDMLNAYPEFPAFLISDCVDAAGNLISR